MCTPGSPREKGEECVWRTLPHASLLVCTSVFCNERAGRENITRLRSRAGSPDSCAPGCPGEASNEGGVVFPPRPLEEDILLLTVVTFPCVSLQEDISHWAPVLDAFDDIFTRFSPSEDISCPDVIPLYKIPSEVSGCRPGIGPVFARYPEHGMSSFQDDKRLLLAVLQASVAILGGCTGKSLQHYGSLQVRRGLDSLSSTLGVDFFSRRWL